MIRSNMTRSKLSAILALAGALAGSGLAHAAGLTARDTRYLDATYGPTVRAEIVSRMTAEEQEKLHEIVADPASKGYPGIRYNVVADYLFTVHMQQCQAWSAAHPDQTCPPPADPQVLPGKNIADQECNACHLFGTSRAPAFRALAKAGPVSEARLADAIGHGHQMSPIGLSADQIRVLAIYINSLK